MEETSITFNRRCFDDRRDNSLEQLRKQRRICTSNMSFSRSVRILTIWKAKGVVSRHSRATRYIQPTPPPPASIDWPHHKEIVTDRWRTARLIRTSLQPCDALLEKCVVGLHLDYRILFNKEPFIDAVIFKYIVFVNFYRHTNNVYKSECAKPFDEKNEPYLGFQIIQN